MKVRWTSSSIRLRITPTELAALQRGEPLEECLQIPGVTAGNRWALVLVPGASRSKIDASGSVVLFEISNDDVTRLLDPTVEGVYCYQEESANNQELFSFYIEKDFPCVHPRGSELLELPTETFSPPAGFAERKI